MARRRARWSAVLGLLLAAAAPAPAGPFLGDWGWCWNPAHDCPHGTYCPLHYWAPGFYYTRMYVHPSYLDQYPPGPWPPPPAPILIERSRCRVVPAAPSAPYADPAGYYGRSTGSVVAPQ